LIRKGFLGAGSLLFLLAGFLASGTSSSPGRAKGRRQSEGPKFYALRVVSEKDVANAENSVGAPDGRFAEIMPGGQLVLLMEKKLSVFPVGSDSGGGLAYSGVIVSKGDTDSLLEGWLANHKARGAGRAWVPLGQSSTFYYALPGGHLSVEMVRITNFGPESLFVDSIIGYGVQKE
jgi:hypothetical protein